MIDAIYQQITFCGVFRNEANRIRQVLDLAEGLRLPMRLAAQDSQDGTLDICREYTGDILIHPAQSPEESKDEIMEGVSTPWTFWLDADEFPSLGLIDFIRNFQPIMYSEYDGFRVPRINYINGKRIEANEGKDSQFRILKSSVRWEPEKQGQRVHIHPLVKFPCDLVYPLYHHRTLAKIEETTARWNELEPKTTEPCNRYLARVKEALSNSSS